MASLIKPADVLREMNEYVSVTRSGQLELGHRLKLWSVMERMFGFEEASTRREALGLLVAADAATRWDAEQVDPKCEYHDVLDGFPNRHLDLARRYIQEEATYNEFVNVFDPMEDLTDHVGFCVNEEMVTVFGAIASLKRCLLQSEDELFIDSYKKLVAGVSPSNVSDVFYEDYRDVHYFGSILAEYFDKQPRTQSARKRHYWLRWIHELAPRVLGSKKKLASLLSE
ncbi:MAG: hypothetical protein ACKVH8_08055 [Pirellulales bacterium]